MNIVKGLEELIEKGNKGVDCTFFIDADKLDIADLIYHASSFDCWSIRKVRGDMVRMDMNHNKAYYSININTDTNRVSLSVVH